MTVAGLLLAAGAGRRMGGPKALLTHPDGVTWVARAAQVLRDGGCDPVLVVVGARVDVARAAVMSAGVDGVLVVHTQGWAEGNGRLAAGGARVPGADRGGGGGGRPWSTCRGDRRGGAPALSALADADPAVLARAGYDGVPGHPVLIGRAHWPGVRAVATGDAGARAYLQVSVRLSGGVFRRRPRRRPRHLGVAAGFRVWSNGNTPLRPHTPRLRLGVNGKKQVSPT